MVLCLAFLAMAARRLPQQGYQMVNRSEALSPRISESAASLRSVHSVA